MIDPDVSDSRNAIHQNEEMLIQMKELNNNLACIELSLTRLADTLQIFAQYGITTRVK